MAFQGKINRQNTFGIAGDLANGQVPHYTPTTPVVAEGATVVAGGFAWVTDVNGVSTCAGIGAGAPDGIVQRTLDNVITDIKAGATMQIPSGRKADIVDFGDMFVAVSDVPTVGNVLFANNTTGAITNAAAGSAQEGATETKWVIKSLANNEAAAGATVIVSNV